MLRRSRTEDLTEVSGIGCLYQSGYDRLGRPVIVFCGKWFPAHEIDLEKVSFVEEDLNLHPRNNKSVAIKFRNLSKYLLVFLGFVIFDTVIGSFS